MKVTVEGLADLDDALGQLPKATAKAALRRTGQKALVPFIRRVRELAPVDADPANSPKRPPGTLRDSYHISTKLNRSQSRAAKKEGKNFVEVYAGTGDKAGVQTELGNSHQAAQPHARTAWDETQAEVLEIVKTELDEQIFKARQRLAKKAARAAAAT